MPTRDDQRDERDERNERNENDENDENDDDLCDEDQAEVERMLDEHIEDGDIEDRNAANFERGETVNAAELAKRLPAHHCPRAVDLTLDESTLDESTLARSTVGNRALRVALDDGRTVSLPLAAYPRLRFATPAELANWELIDHGAGIHWPDLDEDISVEGLIAGRASGESRTSLHEWLRERRPDSDSLDEKERAELHAALHASTPANRKSCVWPIKAKVIKGRYVVTEPVDLPEGTELILVPVEDLDSDC